MTIRSLLLAGAALGAFATVTSAHADTVNASSVFATGGAVGGTAPDSLTDLNGSIWAEYGNGVDSTGIVPGTSTIVQYSATGAVQSTYSISGSVDGLKANPVTGQIWALQNQDGNATLSLIDPAARTVAGPISYVAPPYVYGASSGRGYDDVAFLNGKVFLSYTNPTGPSDPVLQILNAGNRPTGPLGVTDILLAGQTGIPTPDIDSLKTTPSGKLVLTAGDQGRFSLITNPGLASQGVTTVQIVDGTGKPVSGLDDVLFPQYASGTLYVTSTSSNEILALDVSNLNPDDPIVSIGSLDELATVDLSTGVATPFYVSSDLAGPHGLDLVAAPEPAAMAVLGAGLLGLFAVRRRRG